MAARAGIRFSTRGAGRTIGKVQGVGAAFGGLGKSSKSASFGIGQVAYRLYNTLARISMVRRGVSGMGREVRGAENKWRGWGRAMGGPFTSVLAGVSKKFAEVRRTVAFYILAIKDYTRWGKKMVGIQKAVSKGGKETTAAIQKVAKARVRATTTVVAGERAAEKARLTAIKAAKAARGKPIAGPEAARARTTRMAARAAAKRVGAPPIEPPPPGVIGGFARLSGVFRIIATAAKIAAAAIVAYTAVLTALYAVVGYFSTKMVVRVVKGFMEIRETFRQYEISLGGIVRNTVATAKIMRFAMKYAAEYPAMFEDVIDAFRGLASMPTLKPLFRKADYDALKGIMDVVQGLATLKPQQGVQGAMMALREALSGQMRSLRMRFEVNVREMADAAGFSFTEITHDANKALIAIRKFVELNVPAEAMASMAKTISVQWGNLYDKYRTFINDMMKSTGAYWAVVTALVHLNEWLEKVFKAPEVTRFAQKVGNALREIVRVIEVAMGGFDLRGYLKGGDIVGAVQELCDRIRALFSVLWNEFGDEAKKALKIVIDALWSMLGPAFKMLALSFWEVLKSGAADAGKAAGWLFIDAFKSVSWGVSKWAYKKLTTLESPLGEWGKRKKGKEPTYYKVRRDREAGVERYGVATDPLKQMALLRGRLEAQIAILRERLSVKEKEPVEVGEEIIGTENKRVKIIKMAIRQFGEWSDKYKWQKKDAEGLLAITKKLGDIIALPKLKKEELRLAEEVDEIGVALKRTNLTEIERIKLQGKDEQLQARIGALSDRIAVAGASKAEDINKLLQAGVKTRDSILEKEKKIVEQIKKAKEEMDNLNASMITGIASTTVSFFNNWRKGFRLIKSYASIMSKTMIPAGIFGQEKGKVTWKEGLRQRKYGEWKGVPTFFRTLIERLRGAITPEKSAAVKRSYTEGLLGLYKEAMSYARGRGPKAMIAEKAMALLPKLLSFQAAEAKAAVAIQQGQYNELKLIREENIRQTSLLNNQVEELRRIVVGTPTAERVTRSSQGNRKIMEANPDIHPLLGPF